MRDDYTETQLRHASERMLKILNGVNNANSHSELMLQIADQAILSFLAKRNSTNEGTD